MQAAYRVDAAVCPAVFFLCLGAHFMPITSQSDCEFHIWGYRGLMVRALSTCGLGCLTPALTSGFFTTSFTWETHERLLLPIWSAALDEARTENVHTFPFINTGWSQDRLRPEKLILASVGLHELSPTWKINSLNQSIFSPMLEVKEYAPHELYFKI